MSYRDQVRYLDTLKRYERKFDSKESSKYAMLKKRHKDDEDLDKSSLEFLKELFEKYHANRPKINLDDYFKK